MEANQRPQVQPNADAALDRDPQGPVSEANAPVGAVDPEEAAAVEAVLAPPLSEGETVGFARACEVLGLTPHVLRRLLDDFEDVLPPVRADGEDRGLAPAAMPVLAAIAGWRAAGMAHEEVHRRAQAMAAQGTPALADDATERLVAEVSRVHAELLRSEQQRGEDRDRMLTALMRTQQELASLRLELAARHRRERKRGFWSRWFGR